MKLIVGLGNPGAIYENTRHNLGARTVKYLAKKYNKRLRLHRSLKTRIATLPIKRQKCMVAIPHVFMNVSGESIALLLNAQNVDPRDILIVHDDMDLEAGIVRLKTSGGAGGHKGVDSIIRSLRTKEFNRLKLGIGRGSLRGGASDYVLSAFSKKELSVVDSLVQRAVQACCVWIQKDISEAMNQFN